MQTVSVGGAGGFDSAPPGLGEEGREAVPPKAASRASGLGEPKGSGLREAGAQDARFGEPVGE